MKIHFHRNFDRGYRKLRLKGKERFKIRLKIFLQNEFDPTLNNHPLKGKYQGCRSINIMGDLRALYKKITTNNVVFVAIDAHSNLYK